MRVYRIDINPETEFLEVFFAGCSMRCEGCFNEKLWDSKIGERMYAQEMVDKIRPYFPIAKQIHLLGGEPLEQDHGQLKLFLSQLRSAISLFGEGRAIPIVLFTGKTFSEVPRDFMKMADYVKIGSYDKRLGESEETVLGFSLASANQLLFKTEENNAAV